MSLGVSGPNSTAAQDTSSTRGQQLLAEVRAISAEGGKESGDAYAMSLSKADLGLLNQALVEEINSSMVIVEEGDFSEAMASGLPTPDAISADGKYASAAVSACYGPYVRTRYAESSIWPHERFWTYSQSFQWCTSGGYVTSSTWCSATVGNTGVGWSFQGNLQYCAVVYGGIGYNTIKFQSQGSFCAGWGYCAQTAYPWIAQQGDGYGNYWVWSG